MKNKLIRDIPSLRLIDIYESYDDDYYNSINDKLSQAAEDFVISCQLRNEKPADIFYELTELNHDDICWSLVNSAAGAVLEDRYLWQYM